MQKIYEQKKLFPGNIKITEICYLQKLLQSIFQSQYEQY